MGLQRTKHIAEYAALRFVSGVVNALPQEAARRLGSSLASIGFRLSRERQERARHRIAQVFGDDLTDSEIDRIARESFRDLVWHTIEILRTPNVSREWIRKHGVLEDEDRDHLEGALAQNKGVILAVPHLANWDLAGVALEQLGYPMTFIVRKQKNPLFDQHLNDMRRYLGSEVIERDDPMLIRKAIRSLKKGNIIAILVDLRARQFDVSVPFLGHTANLARGVGVMSHLSGCPVLPSYVTRPDRSRIRLHFTQAIQPDPTCNRNEDAERILRASLPPLEAAIRAHPEQYFWYNKRWVLEPIESPVPAEPAPAKAA